MTRHGRTSATGAVLSTLTVHPSFTFLQPHKTSTKSNHQKKPIPTMSFFDEPNNPSVLPENIDPRVKGWNAGHVQTAATPGYERQAKQAQAAADNVTRGRPAWSTKDLTNMIPEVQASSSQRHAQSFASRASEKTPAVAQKQPATSTTGTDLPPHLRTPPKTDLSWMNQPSSTNSKAPTKMNSGKAAKSAKFDSPFPCTYDKCTRGFVKERDMKKHKDDDHEWCRVCNVDCEDDDALLYHKINSERHICCAFCGEDFRSEAGRDRHQRQVRLNLYSHLAITNQSSSTPLSSK